MKRMHVESSTLRSVGYNVDTETLELEFAGGDAYKYFHVPPSVYLELMNSNSKGAFFNNRIKDVYDYEKITSYFA